MTKIKDLEAENKKLKEELDNLNGKAENLIEKIRVDLDSFYGKYYADKKAASRRAADIYGMKGDPKELELESCSDQKSVLGKLCTDKRTVMSLLWEIRKENQYAVSEIELLKELKRKHMTEQRAKFIIKKLFKSGNIYWPKKGHVAATGMRRLEKEKQRRIR